MQAARDIAESRKLALAAGDLVTLVDHRWVTDDGDPKCTQWLFETETLNKQLLSRVSGCQNNEYNMMYSRINLVVSLVPGFIFIFFNKITAISGYSVIETNKRHQKVKLDSPATFESI